MSGHVLKVVNTVPLWNTVHPSSQGEDVCLDRRRSWLALANCSQGKRKIERRVAHGDSPNARAL